MLENHFYERFKKIWNFIKFRINNLKFFLRLNQLKKDPSLTFPIPLPPIDAKTSITVPQFPGVALLNYDRQLLEKFKHYTEMTGQSPQYYNWGDCLQAPNYMNYTCQNVQGYELEYLKYTLENFCDEPGTIGINGTFSSSESGNPKDLCFYKDAKILVNQNTRRVAFWVQEKNGEYQLRSFWIMSQAKYSNLMKTGIIQTNCAESFTGLC